jgi:hypothetical protein
LVGFSAILFVYGAGIKENRKTSLLGCMENKEWESLKTSVFRDSLITHSRFSHLDNEA